MKTLHTKEYFNNHLLDQQLTTFQNQVRIKIGNLTAGGILCFLLMLPAIGDLNAETAASPCECLSVTEKGVTGESRRISTLGEITNCTKFKGNIVIDVPTNFANFSIEMETGSSIEVTSTLTFYECNIGTCEDLWRGMFTNGSAGSITFLKSTISGAEIAIRLNDQADYYIVKSKFVNNYIGVATGSPFEAVPVGITVTPNETHILGCQFYTETQLPDPYPGQYYYPSWPSNIAIPFNQGFAALYIVGCTGLDIGNLGATSATRNKIYNMRNGVIAINSNTNILGTDFKDFEGSFPKPAIFNTLLNYNQRGITLEGSVAHIEQDTIKNVMIGVHGTRSSQKIVNNYINIPIQSPVGATRGIDLYQLQTTYIGDNKIYNGFMGISVNGSGVSLLIEDNNLYRSLTVENNVGINLHKLYSGSIINSVQENELDITGGKKAVGISMNTVNNLRLYHNTIDFLETLLLPPGTENAGISGMQVYNSRIGENYITGTDSYKTGSKNAGISITNSMSNDLYCNNTHDMYYGHWYIGANMDTELKSNEFYDATNGLDLFSPVYLGTQEHHANQWLGSYVGFGAFISGTGDPDETALYSQFIVDESDAAPGVLIPASIGPVEVESSWFFDVAGEAGGVVCNDYGDLPIAGDLVKLVRNAFVFSDFEDEMNWMRKADMLTFLHLYPSYLSNTVLDSFFDAESTTPLGELIWAQYQIGKIHGIDSGMDTKDDQVFNYLAQVRVLDSLIGLNPINIATLKSLRILKIDTLAGHFSDWLGMLDSQISDTEDEILDALYVVDNVTPTNNLESELQTVLWLLGDRSLGDSLTTVELAGVYSLARQCPWMGARSLSESQILYSLVADSIFTHRPGYCSVLESFMLEDRSDDSDYTNEMRIYPNPASDVIFMELPTWASSLEINSLDGRQWKYLNTPEGGNYTISISDIPSGIYTIMIEGGKKVEVEQLFISR
jgi:type IX secretion system substrate protein